MESIKQTNEHLELLMTLMDTIPDSIYFKDIAGRFVMVNRAKAKHSNTVPQQMTGKTDHDYLPSEQAAISMEMEQEVIRTGKALIGIVEKFVRKDGRRVCISATKIPWYDKHGNIVGIIGISRDITELEQTREEMTVVNQELEGRVARRTAALTEANERLKTEITERSQAEEKVRENYHIQKVINSILMVSLSKLSFEAQLQRVLDLILSIPWLRIQSKGCIFLADNAHASLRMAVSYGLDSRLLHLCNSIPYGKCLCGRAALSGQIVFIDHIDCMHDIHYEGMHEHGHYCVPVFSGQQLLGVVNLYVDKGHKRDDTEEAFLSAVASATASIIEKHKNEQEKQRLNDRLTQAEKLSALGRLSANVAHEIRNPLMVIGGYARRLNKLMPQSSWEKQCAEVIYSEVTRLEMILKNALSYAKNTQLNLQYYNVNHVVEESINNYADICSEKNIRIKKTITAVPDVPIDKSQIRQVMDNLISNAIDAMPTGGVLGVSTETTLTDQRQYVIIKVTDTGTGVAPDKLNHIFEPFFSTKEIGTGTGLGLPLSKKIVQDHGGDITVESRPGQQGCIFRVNLPTEQEMQYCPVSP
ncbi:MAG: PAS domain-containing protein [Nitrospirae bacterium]|uniref:ATP-binding protein n=1 Tax=Candidatus Magnetobacterium casense TaxID=1455061 RepID=UPI00069786AA|nr:ATP-binding protein [Candidatus Magnetobacterium casensis]MBF0337561.1 PAS domain-containing protein [Nitrospirota bacterium]